ncbi:GTP-binding protein REM 2-like [Dreissena polymorpha]|uniref:Uncharacterized protein n=1 Tax=Dreissena polymorpha TaxID=45954 RepID=A0A9D4E6L3_DREPO|nr:GTP-binding protein REM 2-like [Dreissena polymorpha]XP_052231271.1 GTP-binding protein REM 2-like [Dreissena polymorpha]KAH3773386.1 hypothetical protein DPMN_174745 [Dreissena polymorpha]KAH3773410.1 hypothetical protein DPMN_174770 [Dreissena polymorpha]
MELAELCRVSEKYATKDKSVRPKTVPERRGMSFSRSIRKKNGKRAQRNRSKSLPSIAITVPNQALNPVYIEAKANSEPRQLPESIPEELDTSRIRQFSTTMKGLVNQGDLCIDGRRDSAVSTTGYRRMSTMSIQSVCGNYGRRDSVYAEQARRRNSSFAAAYCTPVRRTSCFASMENRKMGVKPGLESSQDSVLDECPSQYQVLVLGSTGVGKSAIISQFTTSEFLGASDVHTDSEENKTSVSVILNQEESVLELFEENNVSTLNDNSDFQADAYMLVYSCADRSSFRSACATLRRLKEEAGGSKTVMIVANKVDLVRKRLVTSDDGKNFANSYNCKYIETSAALNHNIDELLAGVLSQIRLKQYGPCPTVVSPEQKKGQQKGLTSALKTAIRGVFGGKKHKVKGCENLYEI